MTNLVKTVLYALLLLLAGISGYFALGQWNAVMNGPRNGTTELERVEPEPRETEDPAAIGAAPDGSQTSSDSTNAAPERPAPPAMEAASREENLEDVDVRSPTALAGRAPAEGGGSRIGLWSGVFILSLIGLGLMVAMDISQYFGTRTLKLLYNDEGEGMSDPEYENAEKVWANGDHLEAIRMMRDYLGRNPREQFVALRIAEIYEKDLGNHLAAALEYEEVLKHKLQPERWGWAAIHLCNLYFKLNQEAKAFALLRRIVREHPNIPAAEKARKRLEQVDAPPESAAEQDTPLPQPAPSAEPEPPGDHRLPPGFRPRR